MPVLVLDEPIGEIHGRAPWVVARQQQAARRVKVDGVRRSEPEVAGLVGETARRDAVGPGERARERFDGVVARLEPGLGDGGAAAEPPGGALQQQAAPEGRRRFADPGTHQAIEVEGAEHRPRRQRPPVEALIERFEHGVDDVAETIRVRRLHDAEYDAAPRRRA